jgi:hypothetical protein
VTGAWQSGNACKCRKKYRIPVVNIEDPLAKSLRRNLAASITGFTAEERLRYELGVYLTALSLFHIGVKKR